MQGKNAKCNVYQGGSYDHNFATMSTGTLDSVTLKPKTWATSKSLIPNDVKSFTFKCTGVEGPTTAVDVSDYL